MELRIVSLGALAAHPLWDERTPVRAGHATTTLVRTRDRVILVDPGLPEAAIVARLAERANLKPSDITDVFLTSFRPDVRRGVTAFEDAEWWIHADEREQVGAALAQRLKDLARVEEDDGDELKLKRALLEDVSILQKCKSAPDSLVEHVDLFPLPGVTPGMCGLLISTARYTTVICGDAVATVEHLEQGKVLQGAVDVEKARESFKEAIEIADFLVLGRDNVVPNPTRSPL